MAAKPSLKWTRAEDDFIVEQYDQDSSWEDISLQLSGRSKGACRKRFDNYLLHRSKSPRRQERRAKWSNLKSTDSLLNVPLVARGRGSRIPSTTPGKGGWTDHEDKTLIRMYNEGISWDDMPLQLNGRSPEACQSHFYKISAESSDVIQRKSYWTDKEDEKLLELHGAGLTWEKISSSLNTHSAAACKKHFYEDLADPTNIAQAPIRWTLEDDEKIVERYVQGLPWDEIRLDDHSAIACKARFYDQLADRSDVRLRSESQKWTDEEDEKIIQRQKQGLGWEAISREIRGRTPEACQTRFSKQLTHPNRGKLPESQ